MQSRPFLTGSLPGGRGWAFEEKVDKKAGLGWTVQSTTGFAHNKKTVSNVSSPLMAEGLALREALKHCITNGLDSIRMESEHGV
ncbi:unnamed protein product [Brassica oleracea]|uniref:RNase H type-1 domain-containing protein n=1 Tax=Brassica oleracea TaxID=3712 RepID=A0A3P6EL36_BRAOL|nr:unnamed protein product [Brassica oleracea]